MTPPLLRAFPFLLVIALIVVAQESFSGFTLWNAFPVVLGFGGLQIGLRSRRAAKMGCITFAALATIPVALFHLAWLLDWGGIATSSSTSALAFIFVPIWTLVFAGVTGAVAWGIARFIYRSKLDNDSRYSASSISER